MLSGQVEQTKEHAASKERAAQNKILDLETQLSRTKTELSQLRRSRDDVSLSGGRGGGSRQEGYGFKVELPGARRALCSVLFMNMTWFYFPPITFPSLQDIPGPSPCLLPALLRGHLP